MTKRNGDFTEMKFKKLKADNDFDDLWDDDASIEDCLIQATQVCEQNGLNEVPQNNISILPNYSFFQKSHERIFTSTQNVFNGSIVQSTNHINFSNNYGSKVNIANGNLLVQNKDKKLEAEVEKLKEKYECKEGEVSILRIQLKEAKTNMEADHQKKEKEWTEKLNAFNKEMISIKTQLEFKNLEVANLKNKIIEISKAYTMDNLYNSSQGCTSHKKGDINIYTFYTKDYKLEPIVDAKYPLMNSIPLTMFNSEQVENFIINLKSNQAFDFLNENADDEVLSKYKNVIESKHFKLDSMLFNVSAIMKCTLLGIDTQLVHRHIDQILTISKCTLRSFHDYLLLSEGQIQKADEVCSKQTSEVDNLNLSVLDSRPWCSGEIGVRARQTVGIVAQILPYSCYMQNTLLTSLTNELNNINEDIDNYLSLISIIINLIHKTKKTQFCNGFLCAVSILLYKIAATQEFSKSSLFVLNMSKKIIFTKPSDIVLRNLMLFFSQASLQKNFDKELCKMSKLDDTGGTSDSCQLPLFIVLYKQAFIGNENLDVALGLNTLQFIKNLLNCNPLWLHYAENKSCDCLSKVVTLAIDVIYELVKNYKTKRHKIIDKEENMEKYSRILKYCLKILHIISFKYFDVIGKYSVDCQYKFVVNYLHTLEKELSMADFENEALCELHVQEDIVAIERASFDKTPIWK